MVTVLKQESSTLCIYLASSCLDLQETQGVQGRMVRPKTSSDYICFVTQDLNDGVVHIMACLFLIPGSTANKLIEFHCTTAM